jgi:hypothetical protein
VILWGIAGGGLGNDFFNFSPIRARQISRITQINAELLAKSVKSAGSARSARKIIILILRRKIIMHIQTILLLLFLSGPLSLSAQKVYVTESLYNTEKTILLSTNTAPSC